MGKKPAFDDAKRAKAIKLAAQCLTMQDVADELGVGRKTLYRELDRNDTFDTAFLHAREKGGERRASSFSQRAHELIMSKSEQLEDEDDPQMISALSGVVRTMLGGLGRVDGRWSEKMKADVSHQHNGLVKLDGTDLTNLHELREKTNGNGSNGNGHD